MKHNNKGKREIILEEGDWVWLHLRKDRFLTKRKSKLSPREDGPFQVLRRINNNAYQIDLPEEHGVHTTFNVMDLTPFVMEIKLKRTWRPINKIKRRWRHK